MFRFLTGLTFVLAVIWGGYWVFASRTAQKGAEALVTSLREAGWQVAHDELSTRGFPSRIDTTVTALDLTNPGGTFRWEAPILTVYALSWKPTEVILAWPEEQIVHLPGQSLTINAERPRASARVAARPDLPLQAATTESDAITVTSSLGWEAAIARFLAAIRQAPGEAPIYDIYAEGTGITVTGLPGEALVRIDATATLASEIGRDLLAGHPLPPLNEVEIRAARIDWGAAGVTASGRISPDASGFAQGDLDLRLRGWTDLLDRAQEMGLIGSDQARIWQQALALAGSSSEAEISLRLAGGQVFLGPLPLGPAPRITYRQ